MSMNEEYKMLRKEIEDTVKQGDKYFDYTCFGIFATTAYTFYNSDNPDIFIAVFIVLAFIAQRAKDTSDGILRIAAYIIVFLEPKIDERNWETYNYYWIYNSQKTNKQDSELDNFLSRSGSRYFLLGIVMYLLYIIVLFKNNPSFDTIPIFTIFGFIVNTTASFILFRIYRENMNHREHRKKYIDSWKTLKLQLEEHARKNNEKHIKNFAL